jgi:hypothetical protein
METLMTEERVPSLGRVLGKKALIYVGLLALVFVLLLVASSNNARADTPVTGDITADTTWDSAGSPYWIETNVAVTGVGTTLTIDPGVQVLFNGSYSITVQDGAAMLAVGTQTPSAPVTFKSNLTGAPGDWNGLVFASTQSGSVLDTCVIQYATDAVTVTDTSVTLTRLSLMNILGDGITLQYTTERIVTLNHLLFFDIGGTGLAIDSDANVTVNLQSDIIFLQSAGGVEISGDNNVTVTLTGVHMTSPGVGTTFGVFAASIYDATIVLNGCDIFDASVGAFALSLNGDATVTATNCVIGNVGGASSYGVAAQSLAPDSVHITVTGSTIENVTTGVYATAIGSVDVDITDCTFNLVTVNAITIISANGAASLTLTGTSLNASVNMVDIEAQTGVTAVVTNVDITNSTNGFDFWSAFGPVDVTMTGVTAFMGGNGVVLGNPSLPVMDGTASLEMTDCLMDGGFVIPALGIEVNANDTVTVSLDNVTASGFGQGFRASSLMGNVNVEIVDSELDTSFGSQISLTAFDKSVSLVIDGLIMETPAEVQIVPTILVVSNHTASVEITDLFMNHSANGLELVSVAGNIEVDLTNVTIVADTPSLGTFVNFGVDIWAPLGTADVDIDGLYISLFEDLGLLYAAPGDDGISVLANGTVDVDATDIAVINGYAGVLLTSLGGDVEADISLYLGLNVAERGFGILSVAGDVELVLSEIILDSFDRSMETLTSYSLQVLAGGSIDADVSDFVAYAILMGWQIEANNDVELTVANTQVSSANDPVYWSRMYTGIDIGATEGTVDASFTDVAIWMNYPWFVGTEYAIDIFANQTVTLDLTNVFIEEWIDGVYVWTDNGDIVATIDSLDINATYYAGIEMYAPVGLIDLSMASSAVDNSFGVAALVAQCSGDLTVDLTSVEMIVSYGYGMNLLTTDGNLDLSLTDIDFEGTFNDAVRGVATNGAIVAVVDPSLIDSVIGYGIYLDSAIDLEFDMINSVINDTTTGVRLIAALDLLDISIEGSTISNCSEWALLGEIDDGSIEFDMEASNIWYTFLGIDLVTHNGPIDVTVADSAFQHNFAYGLFVQGMNGNDTVTISGTTVNDTNGYGIAVVTLNGTLTITMTDDAVTNCNTGLDAETDVGDITLMVDTCLFQYDDEGVDVNAGGNAYATIVDTQVLATFDDGMTISADLDVFLTVTDSVFDGGDAANAETFVPSIDEAEYAIINPDDYVIPYNDDYLFVDLPFDFAFNGNTYDEMLMSSWGWISPNLGLTADDLYGLDWGVDLIQPAPYYWYSDQWPGIGYKVNDSRGAFPENVVFQWYVWNDGSSDYNALKNVFEVWLYPNGDIEFRYAMMEGPWYEGYYGSYYGYGIGFDSGMNWDLSMLDSNFLDMAWHSVYFAAEYLSGGGGLLTASGGNTTASVTTSEFSNYVDYGLYLIANGGWMVADVTESSFSHIYNDGEGALHAVAYNDAMDLTVQNDEFSYLYADGVNAMDAPNGDGGAVSSSMVVTDNMYFETMMTFDLESYVYEGVNEAQVFEGVKTFSNNLGHHVGTGYMGTFLQSFDLNWTYAETDTMSDNDLTGLVSIWLQMIGSPEGAMLEADFGVDNEGSPMIEASWNVVAERNVLTDPGLWLMNSVDGIDIEAVIYSDGPSEVLFEASVVADYNNITTTEREFANGIYIELRTNTENTDVLMMTGVETNFNVLKSDYGYFDDAIFAEVHTFGDDGSGSQDLLALFNGSGNEIWWADSDGIGFEAYAETYNQRGHANVDTTMIVENNEIWYCVYGIDEEAWVNVEFNTYFPPYEEVAVATGNLLLNGLVLDNQVYGCDDSVYLYAQVEAYGDQYGVFSEASATGMGAFTVTGNYLEGDIEAYLYSFSQAQMSDAVGNYAITFEDNVVYGYFYVETYVDAWTAYLRYFDEMTATLNVDINVNDDVMYYDGIYVTNYVYTGSYSGSGVSVLNEQIDIHDVQMFSVYDDGVYIYTEIADYLGYDGYPLALANITANIIHNEINGGYGDTGIGFDVGRSDDYTDVLGEVLIADNVIQYMDEGIYVAGELHEFWDEIPVFIRNNTMTNVYTGIEIQDGLFYIYDDRITYTSDGIDIYGGMGSIDQVVIEEISGDGVGIYPIGVPWGTYEVPYEITLINSVITNVSGDAIHVEEAQYLMIADNTITNVGDDGIDFDGYAAEHSYWWYSYEVWVTHNTFTSIGDEGMYFYGVEDLYISDNTITNAFSGIYVDETYYVEITSDVIDGVFDGIGVEDSSYVSVSMCTLNGLPASDLGVIELGGMYIDDSYMVEVLSTTIVGFENGIYADENEYLMFEDILVTGSVEYGVTIYDSYMVQIGNSTISDNGINGLEISDCDEVLLINVDVLRNGYEGLLLIEDEDVLLMNGNFVNNGDYGILALGTTLDWIVNETSEVRNNGIEFGGDVTVRDGGVLSIVEVYWYVDDDEVDGLSVILVQNGGTMNLIDSTVEGDWYAFNVFGSLQMMDSTETGAIELLLGAGSDAYIESSTIAANGMNGIHVIDSAPVILTSTIVANDRNGIYIEGGEAAAPSITDCMILDNQRGIYATGGSLESVTDNLFILNFEAGIYAVGVTGSIHDNTLLLDGKEIYVRDSTVTIMNNEIGYTRLVQVLAQLLPVLGGNMSGMFGGIPLDLEMLNELVAHHTGLYAVNSKVTASGNTYGLLMTAVILTQGSELSFADTIKQDVLLVPYIGVDSVIRNMSVPIPVYDGIVAIDSSVTMNGAKIDVLDDALFLDHSTATIVSSTLSALDFSIYAMHASTANVVASTFGKAAAEDSSVIHVSAELTVVVKDPWGAALANVPVNVTSATHVSVSGVTDSNGVFARIVAAYTITASGIDPAVEPYTVRVNFTTVPTTSYPGFHDVWSPAVVTKTVTVSGATSVTVQTSLIVNYDLVTLAKDPMGNAVRGASVAYVNAMGTGVASGITDANGRFAAEVVAFIQNPSGPDASMNPYAVNVIFPANGTGYAGTAMFMPRDVSASVTVDQQTKTVTVKTGLWMYFDMTVNTRDKDNKTAANTMVTIFDGSGALIRQAPTDANGMLVVSVIGWKMSADGAKDTSMNPYQVRATFGSGIVTASVDMSSGPVAATLKEGAPPTSWNSAGVMGIVAAFIAGGSLLALARKP